MNHIFKASITLDEQGKVLTVEEARKRIHENNEDHIDWYFDPFCPFCVKLDSITKEQLPSLLKETGALITYHLVSFLNERITNDYSDKAASFILGVGEVRGDLFYNFMHGVMNDDFHPAAVLERTDEDFRSLFESLGGTLEEWERIKALVLALIPEIQEETKWFFSEPTLAKKSPLEGETFVPFIFVNDGDQAFNVHKADTFENFIRMQIKK